MTRLIRVSVHQNAVLKKVARVVCLFSFSFSFIQVTPTWMIPQMTIRKDILISKHCMYRHR